MTLWLRLRDWYQAGVRRRLHQVLLEELAQADHIDWHQAYDAIPVLLKDLAKDAVHCGSAGVPVPT
jgi:hypothetical protein